MNASSRSPRVIGLGVVVCAAVLCFVPSGDTTVAGRFVSSLRLAKPKPDTAGANVSAPLNGGRRLQDVLAGIVAESTIVAKDESNETAATADAATQSAGFRPRLLSARGAPSITVLGGQRVEASVNAKQLRTVLAQAGHRDAAVPPSVDHATVAFATPRGVRIQYGNCPAPVSNTIQGQLQGQPPPSADNASCVAVTQVPIASLTVPPALDTSVVMELALELAGMSPNQARDFRRLFAWPAAAAMALPRAIRSYQLVRVADADGMLVITGGRRGPTYALTWVRNGMVYSLTGYGSSAEAVSLATSLE